METVTERHLPPLHPHIHVVLRRSRFDTFHEADFPHLHTAFCHFCVYHGDESQPEHILHALCSHDHSDMRTAHFNQLENVMLHYCSEEQLLYHHLVQRFTCLLDRDAFAVSAEPWFELPAHTHTRVLCEGLVIGGLRRFIKTATKTTNNKHSLHSSRSHYIRSRVHGL